MARNRQQVMSTCKEKKERMSQHRQLHSVGLYYTSHYCHCSITLSIAYLLTSAAPTAFSVAYTTICIKTCQRHTRSLPLEESTRMRVNFQPT